MKCTIIDMQGYNIPALPLTTCTSVPEGLDYTCHEYDNFNMQQIIHLESTPAVYMLYTSFKTNPDSPGFNPHPEVGYVKWFISKPVYICVNRFTNKLVYNLD